jgi:PAS domain S-box-containing protein
LKLQKTSLIVFVSLLIAFLFIVSVFFTTVLLGSYRALEEKYVEKDLGLATGKLNEEFSIQSCIASDWGPWDDTYNFVNGDEPNYLQANLQPVGFDNININLIVITNTRGEVVFSGAYDIQNRVMVPVPAFFFGPLDPANPLMNMSDPHQTTAGILMLPEDPMIVVSQPIVRSDYSGPPRGVIIMGRYLNKEEISRLAELTKTSLTLMRIDNTSLSPDLVSRIRKNPGQEPGIIQPLNPDQVAGYALIRDIYGKDALVLQIVETRDIFHQGINTTMQVILIILLGGLGLGLVIIILLDRTVLKRLSSLALQVNAISQSESPVHPVEVGGDDELSELALSINQMLKTIEHAQQKIQLNEARFRELAEQLPLIIFEMDIPGNITYVNKKGFETFGITEHMIEKGINIRHFLSPDNISQMQRGIATVMAGFPSLGEVYTLLQANGTIMKAIVLTSLIKKEGTITGFRGIVLDVTEQTMLREKLEENTKLLTGILQASPVGVFRLNSFGYVTFVNETFTKITGIPFETIQGIYWADILPRVERDRVLEELGEFIRERKTSRTEVRYIHPDGTPYWLFAQTVQLRDNEGNIYGWVGTITDITSQKFIEDALKESEEKYRALTENTPDILFSIDMDGIITYASPQVNKYGFLEDEVIGKPLSSFIHPLDIKQVHSNLSREMEAGAQFVSRFRILDKWGNIFWFEEKSSLRLDIAGNPIGIYGILRDITERKQVEDAIEIANKKLNLMNQITRHDILNTITGLLGCLDMAKASSSPEEIEPLLNDIRDLTRAIQRQITFTKEYQEVGVHLPQWQNVNDLINKVVKNFDKSGITFTSEFEKTLVYADPLLEKVFYNLVDNAIRYGVTLTTMSIYPAISDKGFSLVFEDNGVGVEPDQKKEIFKRGVGKNTGMGLFLTAEILAITGITIEENGILGKGARFEIRIPNGYWRLPLE